MIVLFCTYLFLYSWLVVCNSFSKLDPQSLVLCFKNLTYSCGDLGVGDIKTIVTAYSLLLFPRLYFTILNK